MYLIFKGFQKSVPGYIDKMLAGLHVTKVLTNQSTVMDYIFVYTSWSWNVVYTG